MDETLDRIHPHWVEEYHLRDQAYERLSLPASRLLSPARFDLFAKLFYIRNRKRRPRLALRVYLESLRALVPFGKEWGAEKEKGSFAAHIKAFNRLIDSFSAKGFDPGMSLIPVGKDDILLDGAHRTAILSYSGKDAAICRFSSVPGMPFPYTYFLQRGMSCHAADLAALEGMRWLDGLRVLILWPEAGSAQADGITSFYRRDYSLSDKDLARLRPMIAPHGPAAAAPAGSGGVLSLILFIPAPGQTVPAGEGCQLLEDRAEMTRAAELLLTGKGRKQWYKGGGIRSQFRSAIEGLRDRIDAGRRFRWNRRDLWKAQMRNHPVYSQGCLWRSLRFLAGLLRKIKRS